MLRDERPGLDGDARARPQHDLSRPIRPLERLINIPEAEFATGFWASRPLLTTGKDPDAFEDLFSTAAVDDLVSTRGLRTPFLRMAKDGTVLPERAFTRSGGTGASIADQVADDAVLGLLAGGSTLVLQALHRTWPPLVGFASGLAAQLGHPVQVNAYITPAQNQGFSAHYDTHDVFVLQVAGSKRWIIHEPVLPHPLPDQTWDRRKPAVAARAAEPPLIDQVLAPGDVLYLPRGYLHSAKALGELSVHLTIGIHPVTRFTVLEELVRDLENDPELRRSLPMGADLGGTQVLEPVLAEIGAKLAGLGPHPHREAIAAAIADRLATATRPAPIAPLATLAAIEQLTPATRIRQRPALRRALRTGPSTVSITALGRTVTMPAELGPAVRVLLDGADHCLSDLPGLAPDERLVLVRRLIREGFVVPIAAGD